MPLLIYFERRLLGIFQLRFGLFIYFLNAVLIFIADFFKILSKFNINLFSYNFILLFVFCFIFVLLTLILLTFLPFYIINNIFFFYYLLFLIILSFIPFFFSLFIYFSNSIFSYIGNLRSVLLLLSYELTLNFSLIILLFIIKNFFFLLILYKVIIIFPCIFLLFICFMSDSSRVPFDLIEGESELVSGFNTELSLSLFLLVFFGEYILLYIFVIVTSFFFLNLFIVLFLFIYIRALLVRFYYIYIIKLF